MTGVACGRVLRNPPVVPTWNPKIWGAAGRRVLWKLPVEPSPKQKNSNASRLPEASRESNLTTVLKTEQGDEAPKLLSKNSIAQENAESKENSEAFYVHEVCWSDGSYVTLNEQGVPTKKEPGRRHTMMRSLTPWKCLPVLRKIRIARCVKSHC